MSEQAIRVVVYTPVTRDTEAIAESLRTRFPQGARIDAASTPEDVAPLMADAEVLMAWKFPGELLRQASRLRWIQKLGTGVEDLRRSPVPEGVVVTNTPDVFGPWVGQFCIAYILAVAERVRPALAQQARREWTIYDPVMLRGKILGIAGLGHIGQETARLARALRMTVHGLRRRPGATEYVDRVYGPEEKIEFLRDLDYLVLALPSTDETSAFMDRDAFSAVKPGLTLVNVGRGAAIVESELIAAIKAGKVSNAVLDVFATEPLSADSPLWDLPGVWITPHIAGPVYVDELPVVVGDQLERYLQGEPLVNVVDLSRGY